MHRLPDRLGRQHRIAHAFHVAQPSAETTAKQRGVDGDLVCGKAGSGGYGTQQPILGLGRGPDLQRAVGVEAGDRVPGLQRGVRQIWDFIVGLHHLGRCFQSGVHVAIGAGCHRCGRAVERCLHVGRNGGAVQAVVRGGFEADLERFCALHGRPGRGRNDGGTAWERHHLQDALDRLCRRLVELLQLAAKHR